MSISGAGLKFYQNNVATTKSTKSVKSTEETGSTRELSEAEEMAIFKKEFYAEIDKIPRDRTIANVAINISEEAFKNMKDDPEYREKILSLLRRDLTSSVAPAPDCSLVITVGATSKDYRGDSWSVYNDSEFYARSQNSFYKKTSGQKAKQKDLLEEYLEKRAQTKKQQHKMWNEKIANQEQERDRLLQSWNNERLLAKASNAYDAGTREIYVTFDHNVGTLSQLLTGKFEPDSDYTNVRELTIQNTNEVAWEHYMAMRSVSSQTLKDGNYNVEDVMKSIMDTYETRYNEIVKEHENGDREVSYGLTGKTSLTLDEDLAGLDEAFKMRLANLEGYITCQQTNKAFENPDSSWYFHRNSSKNEGKTQDKSQFLDTEYRESAVSIMEQTKEKFLAAFQSSGYKKGAAISILSDIMNENTSFAANTQKLFS